jgi:hypothetical protein
LRTTWDVFVAASTRVSWPLHVGIHVASAVNTGVSESAGRLNSATTSGAAAVTSSESDVVPADDVGAWADLPVPLFRMRTTAATTNTSATTRTPSNFKRTLDDVIGVSLQRRRLDVCVASPTVLRLSVTHH